MCGSMVDIQSPTAEIRRGKKERRRLVTTAAKYNGLSVTMGGHNKSLVYKVSPSKHKSLLCVFVATLLQ